MVLYFVRVNSTKLTISLACQRNREEGFRLLNCVGDLQYNSIGVIMVPAQALKTSMLTFIGHACGRWRAKAGVAELNGQRRHTL